MSAVIRIFVFLGIAAFLILGVVTMCSPNQSAVTSAKATQAAAATQQAQAGQTIQNLSGVCVAEAEAIGKQADALGNQAQTIGKQGDDIITQSQIQATQNAMLLEVYRSEAGLKNGLSVGVVVLAGVAGILLLVFLGSVIYRPARKAP